MQIYLCSATEDSTDNGHSNKLRLPTTLRPMHYRLVLQPFVGINNTAQGEVEIQLNVVKATSKIRLHISDIAIESKGIKVCPYLEDIDEFTNIYRGK